MHEAEVMDSLEGLGLAPKNELEREEAGESVANGTSSGATSDVSGDGFSTDWLQGRLSAARYLVFCWTLKSYNSPSMITAMRQSGRFPTSIGSETDLTPPRSLCATVRMENLYSCSFKVDLCVAFFIFPTVGGSNNQTESEGVRSLANRNKGSRKLFDTCQCLFLCMTTPRVKMQHARLRRPNLGKLFKKAETTFKLVRLRHCDIFYIYIIHDYTTCTYIQLYIHAYVTYKLSFWLFFTFSDICVSSQLVIRHLVASLPVGHIRAEQVVYLRDHEVPSHLRIWSLWGRPWDVNCSQNISMCIQLQRIEYVLILFTCRMIKI